MAVSTFLLSAGTADAGAQPGRNPITWKAVPFKIRRLPRVKRALAGREEAGQNLMSRHRTGAGNGPVDLQQDSPHRAGNGSLDDEREATNFSAAALDNR